VLHAPQTIKRSKIKPQPAVAVIPLGTGNDLSRAFGWGGAFNKKWIKGHGALYQTLQNVATAEPTPLDMWELKLKAPSAEFFKRKRPYAFIPIGDAEVRWNIGPPWPRSVCGPNVQATLCARFAVVPGGLSCRKQPYAFIPIDSAGVRLFETLPVGRAALARDLKPIL
jgi:Diacylglycerol kinase catalytic domain